MTDSCHYSCTILSLSGEYLLGGISSADDSSSCFPLQDMRESEKEGSMSEALAIAEALELLFTSATPGWFSPYALATDGLTAEQAATVPAPRFNSVWAVVNHVRYWQEVPLLPPQHHPVGGGATGSEGRSGSPPHRYPTEQ